ncbi:Uncharacterised protein r2_g4028 [Pycnogonum litorale]
MNEAGKTFQVAREMKRFGIEMLGLNETRWTGSDQIRQATREKLPYSDTRRKMCRTARGIGMMLGKVAQKTLLKCEPRGPRLMKASFSTIGHKRIKLNVMVCYAPTNEAEEDDKDTFYEKLEELIASRQDKGITLILGDMNAKVGGNNEGYEEIMGRHGLWRTNEERMCQPQLGDRSSLTKTVTRQGRV